MKKLCITHIYSYIFFCLSLSLSLSLSLIYIFCVCVYMIEAEFFNWIIICITILYLFHSIFLANFTISMFTLSHSHRCSAILLGTLVSAEFSSAHKIDLYNLPDTMCSVSVKFPRANIRTARSFNEFIQPRCVLLSRWLSRRRIDIQMVSVSLMSILRGIILKYPAKVHYKQGKLYAKYGRYAHTYTSESRKIIWACTALQRKILI